jgi:hypothetical protein
MCKQWGLCFCSKIYWYRGKTMDEIWNVRSIGSRKIYLKLLLISFNHVNNVMCVFSCQRHLSVFLVNLSTTASNGSCMCLCIHMPVAMPRLIIFPVPLWRVDMSVHGSKNAERSFGCCCGEWHCKQNFQNTRDIWIRVFVYKFQYLIQIARVYLVCGVCLPPCIPSFYFYGKLFMSLQICPIIAS